MLNSNCTKGNNDIDIIKIEYFADSKLQLVTNGVHAPYKPILYHSLTDAILQNSLFCFHTEQ